MDSEMEEVRSDIKRLIQSLQQYAPSQLSSRLVEFALKESTRVAEGKEMELDEGQDEEDEDEEVDEGEEYGEEETINDEGG